MHPILVQNNITYGVYLIEPRENITFNRGLLMNIGFLETIKDSFRMLNGSNSTPFWDCFVFHDTDLLPEENRLYYTCDPDFPLHYSVAVDKFNYS